MHRGHLQLAAGMRDALALDRVLLIPNHEPPHRPQPQATPGQRCEMLALALDGQRGLQLDRREIDRDGPSYAVDTLTALRQELGPEVALFFLLGSDAFAGLDRWHQWQRLPQLCHFAIALRPGCDRDALLRHASEPVRAMLDRACSELPPLLPPAGLVLLMAGDWPDISASSVRSSAGRRDPELAAVTEYIRRNGLYQAANDE